MRTAEFRSACIATLLVSATFFAMLLFLPQFFQKILGYSPLEAGAALLPMMGIFAVVSFIAGSLYERLGAKTIVSAGAACLAVGTFLVSLLERDSGWAFLVPAMVITGLGVGLFYSSITTAAVTALDPSRASLAGGIVYMFQVAGGAISLGLTTTVFTTASEDRLQSELSGTGLSNSQIDALHGALAGTDSATSLLARFPGAVGDRLVELVRESFAAGMQWAFRLVAALALAGLLVSVLFVGGSLLGGRVSSGRVEQLKRSPAGDVDPLEGLGVAVGRRGHRRPPAQVPTAGHLLRRLAGYAGGGRAAAPRATSSSASGT